MQYTHPNKALLCRVCLAYFLSLLTLPGQFLPVSWHQVLFNVCVCLIPKSDSPPEMPHLVLLNTSIWMCHRHLRPTDELSCAPYQSMAPRSIRGWSQTPGSHLWFLQVPQATSILFPKHLSSHLLMSDNCHYIFLGYHYLLVGWPQQTLSWWPNYLLCLSLMIFHLAVQMILSKWNLTSHPTTVSMIPNTCSEFPKDNVKILKQTYTAHFDLALATASSSCLLSRSLSPSLPSSFPLRTGSLWAN